MRQTSKNVRNKIFDKKALPSIGKKFAPNRPKSTLNKNSVIPVQANVRRAVQAIQHIAHTASAPLEVSSSLFLTGGIGDVFAIESYFSDETRKNLDTIYYGTRQHKIIQEAFSGVSNIFPNLKNHIVSWSDFSNFWAFYSKLDCARKMSSNGIPVSHDFHQSADWSISKIFNDIKRNKKTYNGCSFLKQKPINISRFLLPAEYVVICPYSTDKRLSDRDFSARDWQAVQYYLEKSGYQGVVLNSGNDTIPNCKCLTNISNQTSILESIEILKSSKFYIGIDSCMCVLAARHFFPANLIIKSVNGQFYDCKGIYCAPNEVRINTKIDIMELDANRESPYLLNQKGRQLIGNQ